MSNPNFWMQTFCKRAFKFDELYDLALDIEDIARPLSRIPRFAGHTNFYLSVAEHSIAVSRMVEHMKGSPLCIMHGLLHDAHEAFTGDIPQPLKAYLHNQGVGVYGLQADIQSAIIAALEIPHLDYTSDTSRVDLADKIALRTERFKYMSSSLEWEIDRWIYPDGPWENFYGHYNHSDAQNEFLIRYYELRDAIGTISTS